MTFKRVFLIVCDSLGIGSDTEAINYGDDWANTIKQMLNHQVTLPGAGNLIDYFLHEDDIGSKFFVNS